MTETLLIIFVKNPALGKVKTRLAATVGEHKALEIYRQLLQHTHDIALPLASTKIVYYTPEIQQGDLWEENHFQKALQSEGDLGIRMMQAFQNGFAQGYQRICLIGSDCYQLTTAMLEEAFQKLMDQDVVLGPAQDGGYYLIGMRQLQVSLFKDKAWSTSSVLDQTLAAIKNADLRYALLTELIDVDEEEDLKTMQ